MKANNEDQQRQGDLLSQVRANIDDARRSMSQKPDLAISQAHHAGQVQSMAERGLA